MLFLAIKAVGFLLAGPVILVGEIAKKLVGI